MGTWQDMYGGYTTWASLLGPRAVLFPDQSENGATSEWKEVWSLWHRGCWEVSHSRLLGIHHGEDDYVEIPSECEIRFLPCQISYPPDFSLIPRSFSLLTVVSLQFLLHSHWGTTWEWDYPALFGRSENKKELCGGCFVVVAPGHFGGVWEQ